MGARLSAGMAMLLVVAAARADDLPFGQPVPVAVYAGRCEVTLPAGPSDDKYLLVVAALTPRIGPHVVELRAAASRDTGVLARCSEVTSAAWLEQARRERRAFAAARAAAPAAEEFPALPSPPREHVFYLFVKDKEFADPAAYAPVTGELAGLGRRCQVYVDRDSPDRPALQPTVDDIVRTFDEEVFPHARKSLGRALDVDRDGRFTVLLTPRLGRLVNGGVSVSGFVRGSDFDRDTPAPFGNRCDMMYLNTDLIPGPHLRTVLAHEYTHAMIFSEHVFGPRPPGTEERDEEGRLNEALAHVVEKDRGYGWTNLDYRVSAFLSAPHRYGLVIPDYYAAGLWRSHGHRGATFLFLEDCIARTDEALVSRLAQSPLSGLRNLEVATQQPFANSFRDWTSAIALASLTGEGARLLFGTLGERWLCGPRFDPVSLKDERRCVSLAGTSAAYLLLHSPHEGGTKVRLETSSDVDLQVTLIRLPRHRARLAMQARTEAGKIRLSLEAHDADIHLTGAAWERLVPTRNERADTSAHNEHEAAECCRAWFGTDMLHPGERRASSPIERPMTPGEAWVFKVCGNAKHGPVTAWAVIERGSEPK